MTNMKLSMDYYNEYEALPRFYDDFECRLEYHPATPLPQQALPVLAMALLCPNLALVPTAPDRSENYQPPSLYPHIYQNLTITFTIARMLKARCYAVI